MNDTPFPLGRQKPQSFRYTREKRMLNWYRHPTVWLEVHVECVAQCAHTEHGYVPSHQSIAPGSAALERGPSICVFNNFLTW